MKISVHTVVKNEVRFIWYSIMSVISYVDEVIIWDTGSTDGTIEVIKELKKMFPEKVKVKFIDNVNKNTFTDVRNQMLAESDSDWFIIVDGDEVWWDKSIKRLVDFIKLNGDKYDSVVSKYYNLAGDMYHIQPENMGKYQIDDVKGNITIRAVNNKIQGLKFGKPHGLQGLFDFNQVLIQNRDSQKRYWMNDVSYLHATNIQRSKNKKEDKKVEKRAKKYKYIKGKKLPLDFYYPESFFYDKPRLVPDIWEKRSLYYEIRAMLFSPLKKVKSVLVKNKVGY